MGKHNSWGPGIVLGLIWGGGLVWPADAGVSHWPAGAFLAHGALALWQAWRSGPLTRAELYRLLAWCAPLWLWMAWRLPLLPLGLFWSSLALVWAGTSLVLRQVADVSGFRALMLLLLRLAFWPSLLCLLPFSLLLGAEVSPLRLLWLWGACGLALSVLVPLAYSDRPSRQVEWELLAIVVMAVLVWAVLRPGEGESVLGSLLMMFPLMLWAGSRCGVVGASTFGIFMLLLPLWFPPEMAPGQGELTSLLFLGVQLVCVFAGQAVAVTLESARRQERQMRDYARLVESLLDHSPNMMSLRSLDGRFLLVNRAYARLLGTDPHGALGQRVDDYFLPDDAATVAAQDKVVLDSGRAMQFEESFEAPDGQSYSLLVSKFPLFDAHGKLVGVGSVDADITQSRLVQQAREEAEDKYRAVVEQSLVGIFIQQHERLVFVNPTLASMGGYAPDELIGAPMEMVLDPTELLHIREQIRRRMVDGIRNLHFTTRLMSKHGQPISVEIHSRMIDYQGSPAFIGVVMDITERMAADAELRLAATVFENSAEGILITDHQGRILTVNEAFTRITGYSATEAVGRVSRMLRQQSSKGVDLLDELARHGHWQGEMLDRRQNGDVYQAELTISAVRDTGGVHTHYVGVFSDITVRKQAEERLHFLANHDPLTKLPNRTQLIDHLDALLMDAVPGARRLALLFIDLDRFKLINDSFGHQAGDEVLLDIALRLTQACGRQGMVARLGGDEFTVVVGDYESQDQLARIAEDLLAQLARPLRVAEHEVYVTGSIGISVFPNDGTDARSLLKNADAAMYRAKDLGKNTYQFFDADMNTQTFERLLLENGLRLALERGEFELHYQLQVDAVHHGITGVEALIRWRHPELGLVPPVRFIPLAEETGLIKPIGSWALHAACAQMAAWDAQGVRVPRVAVNLSARQFEQQDLLLDIGAALAESGLEPNRLELEITESMLVQNPVEAVSVLRQLKALGVQLSLDDFGTGYSSLSMLKRFPLDHLKVDRSFVEGLPDDEDSAAIAQAIVAMARKLKFSVIAEGVETARQSEFLQLAGCSVLQGYLFGHPLPAAELARRLQDKRGAQGRAESLAMGI